MKMTDVSLSADQAGGRRPGLWWAPSLLFILALFTLAATVCVLQFAHPMAFVPTTDEWRIVERLLTLSPIDFIFSAHNGHRIVIANIAVYADYALFDFRNQFAFFAGVVALCLSIVILAKYFYLSAIKSNIIFAALGIMCVILIYIESINWRNIWDPVQSIAVHFFLFFTLIAIALVTRGIQYSRPILPWLGALFGVLASVSFSFGLSVPYLGVLALLYMRRWAQAAVLFAACVALTLLELPAGVGAAHVRSEDGAIPAFAIKFVLSVGSTTAAFFRGYLPEPTTAPGAYLLPVLGYLILLGFATMLVFAVSKGRLQTTLPFVFLMLIALGAAAMIFVGRSAMLPIEQVAGMASAPRYFIVSYLFIAATGGMFLITLDFCRIWFRRAGAILMVLLALLLSSKAVYETTQYGSRYLSRAFGVLAAGYMAALSGSDIPVSDETNQVVRAARLFVTERIKRERKGVFSRSEADYVGRPVEDLNAGGPIPDCAGGRVVGVRHGRPRKSVEVVGLVSSMTTNFLGGIVLMSDISNRTIAYAGVTGIFLDSNFSLKRGMKGSGFIVLLPEQSDDAIFGRTMYFRVGKMGSFCKLLLIH